MSQLDMEVEHKGREWIVTAYNGADPIPVFRIRRRWKWLTLYRASRLIRIMYPKRWTK